MTTITIGDRTITSRTPGESPRDALDRWVTRIYGRHAFIRPCYGYEHRGLPADNDGTIRGYADIYKTNFIGHVYQGGATLVAKHIWIEVQP